MLEQLLDYFKQFVHTPWVFVLLSIHAFFEAWILPGAHDFFIGAAIAGRPQLCWVFALISSIASTAGGCFGYAVGRAGGRPLFSKFVPKRIITAVDKTFQKYGIWAIAIAGFTPVPFKFFAVSAGIFKVNFSAFFIITLIARSMRFFSVAGIIYILWPYITVYYQQDPGSFWVCCGLFAALCIFLITRKKKRGTCAQASSIS